MKNMKKATHANIPPHFFYNYSVTVTPPKLKDH